MVGQQSGVGWSTVRGRLVHSQGLVGPQSGVGWSTVRGLVGPQSGVGQKEKTAGPERDVRDVSRIVWTGRGKEKSTGDVWEVNILVNIRFKPTSCKREGRSMKH